MTASTAPAAAFHPEGESADGFNFLMHGWYPVLR